MNEEERIKFMQYMIETKIKEIKEKQQKFIIYLPCGEIIADDYKFWEVLSENMDLYKNGTWIATVKIWAITKIS